MTYTRAYSNPMATEPMFTARADWSTETSGTPRASQLISTVDFHGHVQEPMLGERLGSVGGRRTTTQKARSARQPFWRERCVCVGQLAASKRGSIEAGASTRGA